MIDIKNIMEQKDSSDEKDEDEDLERQEWLENRYKKKQKEENRNISL